MSARETTDPESSQATYLERRTYVRLASDLEATARSTGGIREVGWPGSVRDISQGGIGLLLSHCFQAGTELAVELREHSGVIRRVIRARVVHVHAFSSGGNPAWLLGCAFDSPLSDEEFESLR
jgi:PilZ domain